MRPCAFFSFPSTLADKLTLPSPAGHRVISCHLRRARAETGGRSLPLVRRRHKMWKEKEMTFSKDVQRLRSRRKLRKSTDTACWCVSIPFHYSRLLVQSETRHTSITQIHMLGGFVLHRRKQDNTSAYLFCRWAAELAATWPPGRPQAHLNMKGSGSGSVPRGLVSPPTCKHCLT